MRAENLLDQLLFNMISVVVVGGLEVLVTRLSEAQFGLG
jgi:hypothetical protein